MSEKRNNLIGTPTAIVIAGGLIAVALYWGGGIGGSGASQQPAVSNEPAGAAPVAGQPQQAAVGEMRPVGDDDHARGARNAKVTIVEYSDLECPFCKRFHPTMQQVLKEYPNDVRWVYRHFPLAQLHSKAAKEAEATECAAEQGKFWELTDKIFEVTPSNDGLDPTSLPKLARQAGVANISQFENCLSSGKYAQHVQDDLADAQAAGGRGTPYSVVIAVDGRKLPLSGAQPYASVKQLVDQALGK